jgi:pyruvate dehydrogenase E1 component alpha subunit
MLLYWGGDERGLISPKGVKNFPIAIPVGTQIAHASGSAWASKIQGKKDVSLALFGDGATSKSEFHTGLNFAGKYGAPAIFVCENNQYAISTPISHQTKSETIAQKAIGYGIKGIQVDGNDIFAVYSVVKEAVDNARKGKGPTLVEALTYRIGDHSTSDDAARYRSKEEVEKWKKKDPIERLEKYMKKKKILSDKQKAEIQKRALDQVEKAVERYENYPAAKKDDIFTYMFDKMPQQLQEQYDEWRRQ